MAIVNISEGKSLQENLEADTQKDAYENGYGRLEGTILIIIACSEMS